MNTTHGTMWLDQTSRSIRHVANFIWKYRDALQERRESQKLRATLLELSDVELMDIGTTRGEIDYIASHRDIDPRGIDPAIGHDTYRPWMAKLGDPSTSVSVHSHRPAVTAVVSGLPPKRYGP
ncbi:DUF1127 domain-containing protein [Bradyrhizobium sp. DASA03076]|uniref:DUF1127 domain-containing protein n=1 Tax=Bradyrhizobium sp. BLXBL-03 TaxID=3395916 RepID=UPI003F72E7A7